MYLLRELLASILFLGLLFALLGFIALLAIAGWSAGRRLLMRSRITREHLAPSRPLRSPGVSSRPDPEQAPAGTL
jgi:hypothetical protein